jgi:tetratricopeptide (TPR) repeat protein
MIFKRTFLSALFVLLFVAFSFAQRASKSKTKTLTADEARSVKKDASGMMAEEDYKNALDAYLELLKTKPLDPDLNLRAGICYVLSNSIKSKGIPYLEAAAKAKDPKKDAQYYLGMAYMNDNRWDDAIKAFTAYKAAGNAKLISKELLPPDRMIEMCNNGKELTSHPVDVKFDNMGKTINSITEDYYPFVSSDERTLVYTSRRKGNMGGMIEGMGVFTADVYWTTFRDSGGWQKGKSIGALVNTDWDEETAGLSSDGLCMFLYFDNNDVFGDLGVSMLKGRNWQKALLMPEGINTKLVESGGCLTNDGTAFFFAGERKESIGGSDIWITTRQGEGQWGPPENIGPVVNTKYDEMAPFLALDGKTLFFVSNGHNSMGGFDIFKTVYDSASSKWSKPMNVGYPLNTADDELTFSMTGNGHHAYISAVRSEGMGDKDIYKITINDTNIYRPVTLVSGNVNVTSGSKPELRQVTLMTKPDKKIVGTYKPYFQSNHYVLSVAKPGDYILRVEGYGFQPIEENITIAEGSDFVKDFTVTISK